VGRNSLFNVQLLRFAAAFAVLFSHAAYLTLPHNALVLAIPWTAGVDVFFVISGFIMTWMSAGEFCSPAAAKRFILRRVVRIVPPYWFFTALMLATLVAAGDDPSGKEILTSLLFIPWPATNGNIVPILVQGWTLNYEAFFYASFGLCMVWRRGMGVLVVALFVLAASHALVPHSWFILRFLTGGHLIEFAAGMLFGQVYLRGGRLSTIGSCLTGSAAMLVFALTRSASGLLLHIGLPSALLAAAVIFAPEPTTLGPVRRALKAGGDASYTLYLSHTFTVAAVVFLSRSMGFAPVVMLILAMAAAVATALLFYRVAEAPVTASLGARLKSPIGSRPVTVAP